MGWFDGKPNVSLSMKLYRAKMLVAHRAKRFKEFLYWQAKYDDLYELKMESIRDN